MCLLILAGLGRAATAAVTAGAGVSLRDEVADAMAGTPPEHEITAVLLDFRSYDTLLEATIVLVAAVGALSLSGPADGIETSATTPDLTADPAVRGVLTLLIPALLLLAGWILFAGSYETGGAFQAAAVLTGAAVLAVLSGNRPRLLAGAAGRVLVTSGVVGFLVLAVVGLVGSGQWLAVDRPGAGGLIVGVETVLAIGLGAGLTVIFLAIGRGAGRIGDPAASAA